MSYFVLDKGRVQPLAPNNILSTGRQEGRQEGFQEAAIGMFEQGLPVSKIASALKLDEAEVRRMLG